jgi:hypothetical protein
MLYDVWVDSSKLTPDAITDIVIEKVKEYSHEHAHQDEEA